ncbi:hypothetical protein AVEN_206224-1 [Araneus ventricosus]|uniref:Uncharacterized protein n=1 Tax=Araneus ventricosus TaxID=182803 RepID=A0A4Y2G907_ARAVE|nr:hypothetical protein AVEN_206224-1 [Araneus ventricosus]
MFLFVLPLAQYKLIENVLEWIYSFLKQHLSCHCVFSGGYRRAVRLLPKASSTHLIKFKLGKHAGQFIGVITFLFSSSTITGGLPLSSIKRKFCPMALRNRLHGVGLLASNCFHRDCMSIKNYTLNSAVQHDATSHGNYKVAGTFSGCNWSETWPPTRDPRHPPCIILRNDPICEEGSASVDPSILYALYTIINIRYFSGQRANRTFLRRRLVPVNLVKTFY